MYDVYASRVQGLSQMHVTINYVTKGNTRRTKEILTPKPTSDAAKNAHNKQTAPTIKRRMERGT